MSEVKIAEGIYVDEPEYVEKAILNKTGKRVDFEIIKQFIMNEKNTMFYLDRKFNSSTEPGNYQDYLWLDTGFRDENNRPIFICLHDTCGSYAGHFTGTMKELSDRVKSFNKKNVRDIEKNYSRFVEKYKTRTADRKNPFIKNVMEYTVAASNQKTVEVEENAFAIAFKNIVFDFPEQEEMQVEIEEIEEEVEEEIEELPAFTEKQNEVTIELLFDQMQKMQSYIEELLEHIEKNEKESKDEIERLNEQNQEYKRALVGIRSFIDSEKAEEETEQDTAVTGHKLLARNEKILVLGRPEIKLEEMRAIARDYFGFEKADFEFIPEYEKVKKAGSRIHKSSRFAAVIFGNIPHKVAGLGNYSSIIGEFKKREDCPIAVDGRTVSGELKITKQSFKEALMMVYKELKENAVA